MTSSCFHHKTWLLSGKRFNIKTLSYQYRNSYHKDKMVSWPSYLYNEIHLHGMNVFILEWGPGFLTCQGRAWCVFSVFRVRPTCCFVSLHAGYIIITWNGVSSCSSMHYTVCIVWYNALLRSIRGDHLTFYWFKSLILYLLTCATGMYAKCSEAIDFNYT